ncbi:hypothetical protein ACS0TY_013485 [Phlomoides rotata]
MGALAKLFTYPEKFLAAFCLILPELIKAIMLSLCMSCKYNNIITVNYKYASMIKKKSSKFCHSKKRRPDLDECSVCLSEIVEGEEGMELDDCKHAFHGKCLEKWLKGYKATCPLCRSTVVPRVVVKEYQKMQSDEEDDWIEKELGLVFLNALMACKSCNGFFHF